MARDGFIQIKVRGVSRLRQLLNSLENGIFESIAKGRIERLIVKRTKDRFAPLGQNPRAQKDPLGRTWRRLAENTRRRSNPNRSQVLVESTALVNSITILQLGMGKALGRATGANSRIGVSPTAMGERGKPVAEYAIVHQTGLGPAPERRFLGVSTDDAKAVEGVIQRIMRRAETGVLAGANPRIARAASSRSLPGADIE